MGMKGNIKKLTREDFERVCSESDSMAQAASKLGLHHLTFTRHAKKYDCYKPNQAGKGIKKNIPSKFSIEDWNNNKSILFTRANIRNLIFKFNLIDKKCNKCQLEKWLDAPIPLELNHINGINSDHRKNNIELLCPNCHALTDNYRGKNK